MSKIKRLQEYEEAIKKLREITATQCQDGNWDHSPYMQGMANGLLLAISIVTSDEHNVEFLDPPEIWLEDYSILDKFNKSPIIVTNIKDDNETD